MAENQHRMNLRVVPARSEGAVEPSGPLVRILKQSSHEWRKVAELSAMCMLPARTVHEELERLEHLGYVLERHPQYGLRMVEAVDLLTADEIREGLSTNVVGREVVVLPEVDSTNDEAFRRAQAGCGDGVVVFSEKQRRGRGRLGRSWASPFARGLWFSVVLRPRQLEPDATIFTLLGAVGSAEAIRSHVSLPAQIRWPNDVVVRSRKLGGVLVEVRRAKTTEPVCVLGIGLDVNYSADEMPRHIRAHATSLMIECGMPVDRIHLARTVLRALERWYVAVQEGRSSDLVQLWRSLSSIFGKRVIVETRGHSFRGLAVDIDSNGALVLQRSKGPLRRFLPHEVTRIVEEGTPFRAPRSVY